MKFFKSKGQMASTFFYTLYRLQNNSDIILHKMQLRRRVRCHSKLDAFLGNCERLIKKARGSFCKFHKSRVCIRPPKNPDWVSGIYPTQWKTKAWVRSGTRSSGTRSSGTRSSTRSSGFQSAATCGQPIFRLGFG